MTHLEIKCAVTELSLVSIKSEQKSTICCKVNLSSLECPITTELFQKRRRKGYDFNAYNKVRDILYNTDLINSIVKLIIHSSVGKLE